MQEHNYSGWGEKLCTHSAVNIISKHHISLQQTWHWVKDKKEQPKILKFWSMRETFIVTWDWGGCLSVVHKSPFTGSSMLSVTFHRHITCCLWQLLTCGHSKRYWTLQSLPHLWETMGHCLTHCLAIKQSLSWGERSFSWIVPVGTDRHTTHRSNYCTRTTNMVANNQTKSGWVISYDISPGNGHSDKPQLYRSLAQDVTNAMHPQQNPIISVLTKVYICNTLL